MNGLYNLPKLFLRSIIKPRNIEVLQSRNLSSSVLLKCSEGMKANQSQKKSSPLKQLLKYGTFGGLAVFGTIGLYGYFKMKSLQNSNLEDYLIDEKPPSCRIAKTVQSGADNSGLKFTLYQYQTCPFCCKVRSYLDYFGFSYDIIEVNSVTHSQTKWSSYKKVPFLLVEDSESGLIMQLKDSTLIISILQSILTNPAMSVESAIQAYPVTEYENKSDIKKTIKTYMNRYFLMNYELPKNRTKEDMVLERHWRRWVDDTYVHMLSPNVYRTMEESHQAFSWFSKVGGWEELFSTWERLLVIYSGTIVMFLIGKKLKKKYHLKEDVRQSLYDESELWLESIAKVGGPYMGGVEPNLADLSMYGVLTAIEGCDTFKDLYDNTKMETWFNRMRDSVKNHGGATLLSNRGKIVMTS